MRLFVLTLLACILYAPMAWGGPLCMDREDAIAALARQYDEHLVAIGIANTGALVERLESAGGKTWTLIATTPDGRSCLIAAGDSWTPYVAKVKGEAS